MPFPLRLFFGIDDNLAVEDFLLNPLPEVVGYGATNIPCVSPLILLGGMRLSIWVDMEVETSCRLMEMEWRF